MKGRVLVIDREQGRGTRAALMVDGRLEDLLIDTADMQAAPDPGAIFWARVDRVLPSGGGAFLQLSPDHQGYLREAKGLKAGGGVLVQVSGLPEPGKAAPVTRKLIYKTRLVIHTPDAPGINVSRQIREPDEQDRLRAIVEGYEPDDEADRARDQKDFEAGGFIIRSAARGADEADIIQSIRCTLGQRVNNEGLTRSTEPGSTLALMPAEEEALREWTDPVPDMIAVTHKLAHWIGRGTWETYALGQDTQEAVTPGDGDPFDHFGVWDEIERLKQPYVELPSGGSMYVEATRAMVTVDVNTGDQFGQGAGMTASIEAARELPRQLRLRGLGGQVTIDFAPIKKMHRKKIEEVLKAAFRKDPVPTTLAGWTPLGNFELQRKRERRPLSEVL